MSHTMEIMHKVNTARDLDVYGKEILDLLTEDGQGSLESLPGILLKMVKAAHLMRSTLYLEIIQKIEDVYQAVGKRPECGPLQCLVGQVENQMGLMAIYQEKLLPLIQMLIILDNSSHSRTALLRILIMNLHCALWYEATLKWTEERLEWTEEMVSTLGLLLKEGADPTWIPQGHMESAMHTFLQRVFTILAHKNHLSNVLTALLPRFLTEQCLDHREPRGTALHALVNTDWESLPPDLPEDFSETCKEIILTVVEANPALRDVTDSNGRNPLQCFVRRITKHKVQKLLLSIANNIIPALETEQNVNSQDEDGQTFLHVLAERVSQTEHGALLQLFSSLKLVSHKDIQDNRGQTVLHILASRVHHIRHETFLELFNSLNLVSQKDIQNKDGQTVLHMLARQVITIKHKLFLRIFESLELHSHRDIQDEKGRTAVHILAEDALSCQELGEDLLAILPLLATKTNVNLCDNDSTTPLCWILIAKARWGHNDRYGDIFSKIEEVLLRKGADADLVKGYALRKPLCCWGREELSGRKTSSDGLHRLLSHMINLANGNVLPDQNTLPDWNTDGSGLPDRKYLPDLKEFRTGVWLNLKKIQNAKFITTIMDILRILMTNQCTAQHAWTNMMREPFPWNFIPLSVMEILCLCAERGAQPTDEELQQILERTNAMTRNEELTVAFLKTLVALHRNKHFTCHLQFLEDFYIVPREILQLGRQLLHVVDKAYFFDSSLKSRFIEILLSVSQDQQIILNQRFIQRSFSVNWLHRSPLHLAVVFLHTVKSLKCLPQNTVTKYINAKDLHGCTPLHLAHLHHNQQAVTFLKSHGAIEDVKDKFGMNPKSIERTIEDHPDVRYKELCLSVLEVKCGVLKQLKPMLVLPEEETQALSEELKTLFERLVKGTQFESAKVVMGGSMRERLKAGCLDEADVQLQFKPERVKLEKQNFLKELHFCLIMRLAEIIWEGIYLRPVFVYGPWKFLREGRSMYKGMIVSVDVVAVIVHQFPLVPVQDVLREHSAMSYCTLNIYVREWNDKDFRLTYFAYEWDMIDSLPACCRLAIVIAKALVQAYDLCRGDRLRGISLATLLARYI